MKTLSHAVLALAASLICLAAFSAHAADKLVVYPAPKGAALNDDFAVRVRTPDGPWHSVAVHLIHVMNASGGVYVPMKSSMAAFDFAGRVEVEVTSRRAIESARVRPLSFAIRPAVRGRALTFTLDRPRNLSIEVNGDIFGNLQLFANPLEANRPDPKDPGVIYFGPGIHVLRGGEKRNALLVPRGKTVYLAGGAIVRGNIICRGVENVRILGRGMVEQSARKGGGSVHCGNSRHVEISGIFTPGCFTGGSRDVRITGVKCISYLGNGDGMEVISSSDVVIDGVFNRNSDDCITVYGPRSHFTGPAKDVIVRNSTLWADVAHPILIGTHGSTPHPQTLENLTFRNLDILDHNETQIDYQGCLALNAGDSNLIRNVRFEDIRVEDFRRGQLLNLRVFFNRKYCTSPGRGIENVTFQNVTYTGRHAEQSHIIGYDDARAVRNIRFKNLVINGTRISDHMKKPRWFRTSDLARIFIGEHVENLRFQ